MTAILILLLALAYVLLGGVQWHPSGMALAIGAGVGLVVGVPTLIWVVMKLWR